MSTNPPVTPEAAPLATPTTTTHAPVAPAWHTVVFVVVIVSFAALSARTQGHMVATHGRVVVYLATLAWEWLLLAYIVWGARKRNVRLRDLAGGKWKSPEDVLIDVAIAFGFWLIAAGVLAGLSFALGLASPSQVEAAKRQIVPLLPRTGPETALWLALSATAGFCEEVMFRGYLQSQFRALTRMTAGGIILQAVLFGIAHAYQGGRRIVLIGVYGALFGMLAAWRKSLRPGMIGHAMQDSFSGLVFRLLK